MIRPFILFISSISLIQSSPDLNLNKSNHRSGFPLNILISLPRHDDDLDRNPYGLSMDQAEPVFDIALEDIYSKHILPKFSLQFIYQPSYLSDAADPQMMIEFYMNGSIDAIIGLPYVFSLAPIARYSKYWYQGIPVFSTSCMNEELHKKDDYPLLSLLSGSYRYINQVLNRILTRNEYTSVAFLIEVDLEDMLKRPIEREGIRTEYSFASNTVKDFLPYNMWYWARQFSRKNPLRRDFKKHLIELSMDTNVFILCGSPRNIREVMLTAHSLGMTTTGDYLFINIDLPIGGLGSDLEQPWLVNDPRRNISEDTLAKEAFKAMKTISLRREDKGDEKRKEMERRVLEKATEKYQYKERINKDYEMNPFVLSLYDAVMLYALGVNETMRDGYDPRNGHLLTKHMWGRHFDGMRGNVSIDENGGGLLDWSLLDFDRIEEKFTEVAYYSSTENRLVMLRSMNWIHNRPPKNLPICGYNKSQCPEPPSKDESPKWVFLLCAICVIVIIILITFVALSKKEKIESNELKKPFNPKELLVSP